VLAMVALAFESIATSLSRTISLESELQELRSRCS